MINRLYIHIYSHTKTSTDYLVKSDDGSDTALSLHERAP